MWFDATFQSWRVIFTGTRKTEKIKKGKERTGKPRNNKRNEDKIAKGKEVGRGGGGDSSESGKRNVITQGRLNRLRGVAGRCNMTSQREIRVEIPASKRANERASEQAMESRKTHPGLSANRARRERNRKWWRRKERASNPTRSRRQNTARVSLFFINRLIGKDTSSLPPYLVLPFHPCFISSNSSSPFLHFLLFPSLAGRPYSLFLFSPFHRQIYPLTFFRTLCFSFSPTPPTILTPGFPLKTTTTTIPRWRRGGGGLCHPVLEHFFLFSRYFIQLFFQKWRESFYYPSARLQCLANNKSMKATFEPRGSFEKSFFANLSLSLSFSFLRPSSRHSCTIFRFTPPLVFNARSFSGKDFRAPYPRPAWKFHAAFFSLFSFHYPLCVFLPRRSTWNSF